MHPDEPDSRSNPQEDIAIVGMSCLFPGADSLEQYWRNIVTKTSCITEATPDWQPELFHDPTGEDPDRSYSKTGGFLGDLCRFDPARHGVPPSSINGGEPDHYVALRCAFEAIADAGVPEIPLNREKTGVIVGRGLYVNRGWISAVQRTYAVDEVIRVLRQLEPDRSEEQLAALKADLKETLPPMNAETVPGLVHSAMVGRMANRLDLRGPAYTIDAACSSVLIALDAAIRELRSGNCDAVLVGGAQVSTPAQVYVIFCHLNALSRAGKIAPFSAEAAGTLVGQGCGMILLKRRTDAVRDGNRIYANLKSVGISSDGRRAGILAPNSLGQQLAINRAYQQTGISPTTVGLVEAHGTGIPLGDRTELQSLTACFSDCDNDSNPVALGSVKSMIGHLLPAAASASIIKTALAVYHRVLPPTLNAEAVHPELEIEKTPFFLCNQTQPWLHGDLETPRRAAVNAFGFGGINAHAILEENVTTSEPNLPRFDKKWPAELVVVSASNRTSLASRVDSLAAWVKRADSADLLDIAAECSKVEGACRLAIVATSQDDLIKKLNHASKLLADPEREKIQDRKGIYWYQQPLAAQGGKVAFLFPGEGGQYVNMMADLCIHFPEVRRHFDLTATALRSRGLAKPFGQLLFPQPSESDQSNTELFHLEAAVASVTAAGRGFLALLKELKIEPDSVVGHSSGEFSALLAAGVYRPKDDADAIEAIIAGADSARQLETSGKVPKGALVAVGGAHPGAVEKVIAEANGTLTLAMDNCPHQVVIAGEELPVEKAIKALQSKSGLCERLPWDRSYHTDAFAPVCPMIDEFYSMFQFESPATNLWSCATAARFPNDPVAIKDLAVEQWRRPVRFRETIQAMHDDGVRIFIEVGPRGNLAAFAADTLAEKPHIAIPLDVFRKNSIEQLCRAVGMLVAHGVNPDLSLLFDRRNPRPIDLNAGPPVAEARQPILPLELPTLEVSGEIRSALRAESDKHAPAGNGSVATVPDLPSTQPTQLAARSENGNRLANQPATPAPQNALKVASNPTRQTTLGRPPSTDRRAMAVADFQRTMQTFLDVQENVTLARGQQASGRVTSPAIQSTLTKTISPAQIPPKPLRFIHRVLDHQPSVRLLAECDIDINECRFLLDHTFFGRGPSLRDPSLRALPIMPLAMSLEMLAEVASQFRPSLHVTALSEIETSTWLTFEVDRRLVRLEAVAIDSLRTRVKLSKVTPEEGEVTVAEAVVEHAATPPSLGRPKFSAVTEPPPDWPKDGLYGPILYHGKAFQGIDEIVACGPSGIQAKVRVPDPRLLYGNDNAQTILPVVLIDTASQLPAMGNVTKDYGRGTATLVFPNRTNRMEFIPGRLASENLVANVRYEQRDGYLYSDVEMTTPAGEVVLRYLGRVEEVVPFPLKPYVYLNNPRQLDCSENITGLFHGVPGIEHCTIADSTGLSDKILVKQFWSDVLARMTLSSQERGQWEADERSPVIKTGWLLARVVAKDAVRQQGRLDVCLADVTIKSSASGQPYVSEPSVDSKPIKISLAHKLLNAVAVASTHHQGVGIDMEPAGNMDPGVLEDGFDATERRILESLPEGNLSAWSAKEAIGKALGQGLAGDPNKIKLVSATTTSEGVEFAAELEGTLARDFPAYARGNAGKKKLTAHCRSHHDLAITLCLINEE